MSNYEIAIIGAGLAGQLSAIALARSGRTIALIAPEQTKVDYRTTALMDQSIRFIERLGLWQKIEPQSAKLSTMQIIDGTDRLLRSPTVAFRSSEIGLPAFGWNMPNTALNAALEEAIKAESNITTYNNIAVGIELTQELAEITLDDESVITSELLIGADGRKSKVREAANIDVRQWSYPQTAVVLNFKHSRPHDNVSTEFHTATGPFTQVPLPSNRSSLVWVVKPEEANELTSLTSDELSMRVEHRMQSMLGCVEVEDNVQAWPLSSMNAKNYGNGRVILIGEAGHGFPPIGAQGLNLSLRDIMVLTDLLGPLSDKPIAADVGNIFDKKRKADVLSRTVSVDLLNRSLLSGFLPVQMVRSAGLHILASLPPLRSLVMREGIEPGRGFKSIPKILFNSLRRQG